MEMQDCDAMDDGMTDETDSTRDELAQWWAEGTPVDLERRSAFEQVINTSTSSPMTTTSTVYSVATWQLRQVRREPTYQVAPKVSA